MALRELLASFGIKIDGAGALKAVTGSIDSAKRSAMGLEDALGTLKDVATGFAAALGVQQIVAWTAATIEAADAAADTADALGLTIEQWQAMQAFGETAGGADMAVGLKTLARQAMMAADGSQQAAAAFKSLGVEVEGADGKLRGVSSIAEDTLAGLADLEDPTRRVAVAMMLFGESGNKMIPSLKDGSDAMREQIATAKRLGVVYDNDFGAAAGEINDTLYYAKRQFAALRVEILRFFLPSLKSGATALTEGTRGFIAWIRETGIAKSAIAALGGTLGVAAGALALDKWGGFVSAIKTINQIGGTLTKRFLLLAAVFLVLQDLYTFLQGGESVIGDALVALGLLDDAKKDGKDLGDTLRRSVLPTFKDMALAAKDFVSQTLIGFGALVGMWTASNDEMAADFEGVFLRNTATLDAFGQFWTKWVLWFPTLWSQALGSVGTAVTGFAANGIRAVEGFVTGTHKVGSAFEQLAQWIERIGARFKETITDPIGALAKFITGSSDADFAAEMAKLNRENADAAYRRYLERIGQGGPSGNVGPLAGTEGIGPLAGFETPAGGATTYYDQRSVSVEVTGGTTPAATGRAVADAVDASFDDSTDYTALYR